MVFLCNNGSLEVVILKNCIQNNNIVSSNINVLLLEFFVWEAETEILKYDRIYTKI